MTPSIGMNRNPTASEPVTAPTVLKLYAMPVVLPTSSMLREMYLTTSGNVAPMRVVGPSITSPHTRTWKP